MTKVGRENHKCFGCGKEIQDYDPHIHVGLDDFADDKGLPGGFGLDSILTFPFCENCTTKGGKWQIESHKMEESDDRG